MKLFGFNLPFLETEPALAELAKKKPPATPPRPKPKVANEIALGALTVKTLIEQATKPTNRLELLKLYEAALSSRACPMSPALSHYVLGLSLSDGDKGVRRAARDVVIKTLGHDTILPAWDSNRNGDAEELVEVVEHCLKTANDATREHDIRFDAFTVAEKIITRLPEHATEPVQSLLTSLALLKNNQLADKAKDLLLYVEQQANDTHLHDATSALRVLADKGKALDLAPKGYVS